MSARGKTSGFEERQQNREDIAWLWVHVQGTWIPKWSGNPPLCPSHDAAATTGPVSECSNGFEGFEGQNDNGVACCPVYCGGCDGGVNCGGQGAAAGIEYFADYTACCVNGVLDTQDLCSVAGGAPCQVDGGECFTKRSAHTDEVLLSLGPTIPPPL